jgi:hypothetical protein
MTDLIRIAAFFLGASLILLTPTVGESSPRKPKGTVLCLPPGSSVPKPCAGLSSRSSMAFRADGDFQGTAILRFRSRPVELEGKVIDVRVPAGSLRRGQVYKIEAPLRQLCSSSQSGQRVQFEIQVLTSDFNQAESGGDADSIGFFQMRCG